MKQINRRQFLKTTGSLAIGAAFLGTAGTFVWKLFTSPGSIFHDGTNPVMKDADGKDVEFVSPYCRTAAFTTPGEINAFDVAGGRIYVAAENSVSVYSLGGELVNNFAVPSEVRDMTFFDEHLYVLFASRIEVYDLEGNSLRDWKACNEDADYCCLTVMESGVYVTDASNKHICQYHLDGSLARFIESPDGFVVPSYSFAITHVGDTIYCSNPGRHRIEAYTSDGRFVKSFGKSGTEAGAFSGCCNPARLASNNAGEILTSEKGIPRVSCYSTDGVFHSILLNQEMLGGGHAAYDVRVADDMLVAAGAQKIQVFQFNKDLASQTLCGSCTKDCPMKAMM